MPYVFIFLAILFLIVVGGSIAYLITTLIAAAVAKRELSRRPLSTHVDAPLPRIAVVIPAHNESLVIASTLSSLRSQNYDRELFDIVVVADNCDDNTADIAREHDVTVFERKDLDLRGKGHALNWAIARLLDEGAPVRNSLFPTPDSLFPTIDAFVIVDADTQVAPDFLSIMAERLVDGTDERGYCALQGRYGVLNASEGWRAGLMSGAFELFNHVRPLGRNRLGMTVGLKGNGMAFSRELMYDTQWSGSVTEDIDFALDLCRRYNLRVVYVPEARVDAQMPVTSDAAASQRSRWESGRFGLMRDLALPMLLEGIRKRNPRLIDAAIDVALPPLADLAGLMVVWAAVVACGAVTGQLPHAVAWIDTVAAASIALFAYILCGFAVAGASTAAYTALVFAPFYAVWKLCLYASRGHRKRAGVWIRTARTATPTPPVLSRSDAE